MSKKELYKQYVKQWKEEHNEGYPSCYDEWLNCEFDAIVLEDDETSTGGVSYVGETLGDFLEEVGLSVYDDIRTINSALKQCGIKEVR